jgi:hypothetical protein
MANSALATFHARSRFPVEREDDQSVAMRMVALASGALRRVLRPDPSLDLETMPDYLKRDMGFLDGHGPRFKDEPRH